MLRLLPLSFVAATFLLVPQAAQGQAPVPSDPEAGSPAGVMYELPFDAARGVAAPRPRGTGGRGARPSRSSGGGGSSLRSENNFGSSSAVPGVAAASGLAAGGDGDRGTGRGDGDRGTGRGDGAAGSGAGSDSGSTGAGDLAGPVFGTAAGGPGPSRAAALFLVFAVVFGGAAAGLLARRAARRA